ncbi:hypothetical protein ACJX0J_028719, partial [Zea mays]
SDLTCALDIKVGVEFVILKSTIASICSIDYITCIESKDTLLAVNFMFLIFCLIYSFIMSKLEGRWNNVNAIV